MKKLRVKKAVLNRARKTVKEGKQAPTPAVPAYPIVALWYPSHGTGAETRRLVKVTKMTESKIHGFQLDSIVDEGPGIPRTFKVSKIWRAIELIGLR